MINLQELEKMMYLSDHPYQVKKQRKRRNNIPELKCKIVDLRDNQGMKLKEIADYLGDSLTESQVFGYYKSYKKGVK